MNRKRIWIATLVGAVAAAAALPAATAHAKGDAGGTLGSGGIAKGDISMDAGETDRVTVDLGLGSILDVSYSSTFSTSLVLTDPDGIPVDLGFNPGASRMKRKSLPVSRPGTYEFTISSADGSQGTYSLVAKQRWPKTIPVAGSGQQVIDFGMPTSGKVSVVVTRTRTASGQPRILSLVDPGDNSLLPGVVEPKKDTAKLPPVTTNLAGTYHLTVTATDSTSSWSGKVTRTVRTPRAASLRLTNGLDRISFADAGVDDVFRRQCAGCHFWASNYPGARGYATVSLAKMRSGNMPPGGGVPKAQIDLVQSWISTGYAR